MNGTRSLKRNPIKNSCAHHCIFTSTQHKMTEHKCKSGRKRVTLVCLHLETASLVMH